MEFYYNPPIDPWLEILYQDEAIMVVNKPEGLLSVSGKGPELYDSILTRIQWEFPEAETAHRLDMATSGLLLVALTKEAERDLKAQFRDRQTEKRYIAVVEGALPHDRGIISLPLICDWPNRPKQMVCFERGKSAKTEYKVLKREEKRTRILLNPITGRSHQLRVHLLAIGHPILGDRFYADGWARTHFSRLHLHANRLKFTHPTTRKWLDFEVAPPF